MRALRAVSASLRQVMGSPSLVVSIWLLVLVGSIPATLVMEEAVREDVGSSLLAEELREQLDLGWLEEFRARRPAVAGELRPVRVSPALWLENLESWLSGRWIADHRGLAASAVVLLLSWIAVQGGILEHLLRRRERFDLRGFSGAAGAYFFRFLRLAVLTAIGYFGVYRLGLWLVPRIDEWTRDSTSEMTVLVLHLLAAGLVATLLASIHLVGEFAKIATVAEGRRSMCLASLRALSSVLRHPVDVAGVFLTLSLVLLAWQITFLWLAPRANVASLTLVFVAFATGQVYLLGRAALRVTRFGAEIRIWETWRGVAGGISRTNQRAGRAR